MKIERQPSRLNTPLVHNDHFQRALGQRAARLQSLFSAQNIDHNYSCREDASPSNAHRFTGQIFPPLILTTDTALDDQLSFSLLPVKALETERYRQFCDQSRDHWLIAAQCSPKRWLPYLDNYLLVIKPNGKLIFICDDHPHVAYGLAIARQIGLVDSTVNLFHVDEHLGNAINTVLHQELGGPFVSPPDLSLIAQSCKRELKIDEHLAFLVHCGLVGSGNIHYVLTRDLVGLVKEESRQKDERPTLQDNSIVLPSQAPELARELGNVVLDLDLDFFAYLHDPLFPKTAKAKLQNCPEAESLMIVKELAKEARVILIATSPDYLEIPTDKIKALIKTVVEAA